MTIDTTRPRVFVTPPTQTQLPFGLLAVAQEAHRDDEHAQLGIQYEQLAGLTGGLLAINADGSQSGTLAAEDMTANTPSGAFPTIYTDPFLIYAGVQARPVGHTIEEIQARVKAKLALFAGRWIEKGLWSGSSGSGAGDHLNGTVARTVTDGVTIVGTTVTSATAAFTSADKGASISGGSIPAGATITAVTNATTVTISAAATAAASGVTLTINRILAADLTPTPGTAASIDLGIGLLENWIGNNVGAQGVIHASRILAGSLWNQVHEKGPRQLTTLGTPVAFGAGYDGTGPNGVTPVAGQTWLYATGPVVVNRSEPGLVTVPPAQKTDLSHNLTTAYATEIVSVGFEGGVAAVLVTL